MPLRRRFTRPAPRAGRDEKPSKFLRRRACRAPTLTLGVWLAAAVVAVLAAFTVERAAAASEPAASDPAMVLESRRLHLRQSDPREWSEFAASPDARRLELRFAGRANSAEFGLSVRQQDVKQAWRVLLNDRPLGELVRDEADLIGWLPVPAGRLVDGENRLTIESTALAPGAADDVRVGPIRLDPRPVARALREATVVVRTLDADSGQPLPARLTIVDAAGVLQTTDAVSNDRLAVRPGVIYSATGEAEFGLPAGAYRIYAGRGFEYGTDSAELRLQAGDSRELTLRIAREVPTPGYVACDTHIHTRTHSGHGDATLVERMITLAGEAIELPVATDHNVQIDYDLAARQLNLRRYFTPVVGNEVTTPSGHFNIFPVAPGARVPDHRSPDWTKTYDQIFGTPGVRIAVLNHARDLHSGVRPFGPDRFQASVGRRLDDVPLRFQALEVINSGAVQTDPLLLPRDWQTLLNRGLDVAPIGASDSHDVSRYIVGQGRTYVRCDDRQVGDLDVGLAVDSLRAGRVLVSYGLLVELTVDGRHRPGDLAAPASDRLEVELRVLGPRWTSASQIRLYANGRLIREASIDSADPARRPARGLIWRDVWTIDRPAHDVHLTAIATGPGVSTPHWATAKPYQPTSPDFTPYVLGLAGPVWIDGDADGRRSSAFDYATDAWQASRGEPDELFRRLAPFDSAVAAQAADLWRIAGRSLDDPRWLTAERAASAAVREGVRDYRESREQNDRAVRSTDAGR